MDVDTLAKCLAVPAQHAKVGGPIYLRRLSCGKLWICACMHACTLMRAHTGACVRHSLKGSICALWPFNLPGKCQFKYTFLRGRQVLVDTLDAVSEPTHEVVRRPAAGAEANQGDARAIALYLFAQLYIRQAQRADAMDVWPSSSPQAAAAAATVCTPVAASRVAACMEIASIYPVARMLACMLVRQIACLHEFASPGASAGERRAWGHIKRVRWQLAGSPQRLGGIGVGLEAHIRSSPLPAVPAAGQPAVLQRDAHAAG